MFYFLFFLFFFIILNLILFFNNILLLLNGLHIPQINVLFTIEVKFSNILDLFAVCIIISTHAINNCPGVI